MQTITYKVNSKSIILKQKTKAIVERDREETEIQLEIDMEVKNYKDLLWNYRKELLALIAKKAKAMPYDKNRYEKLHRMVQGLTRSFERYKHAQNLKGFHTDAK